MHFGSYPPLLHFSIPASAVEPPLFSISLHSVGLLLCAGARGVAGLSLLTIAWLRLEATSSANALRLLSASLLFIPASAVRPPLFSICALHCTIRPLLPAASELAVPRLHSTIDLAMPRPRSLLPCVPCGCHP